MRHYPFFALAFALAMAAAPTLAQQFKAGDIVIDRPWARATPKGADVGAAYLTVHNNGATAERLSGGTADFASVEIHEMKTEGGVMKMRELTDGLEIPAHATIQLAPGGYHIMLTHLTKPLTKGDKIKATLTFEHAGPLEVEFTVQGIGASGGGGMMKGGEMGGMKM